MPTVKRVVQDTSIDVARLAEEYRKAKEFAEAATRRADELKKQLSALVDSEGTPDDKGNLWVTVSPTLSLKRERRVSSTLDTNAAERWAKGRGLWPLVSEIVEQVSEEKVLTLSWEQPDLAPEVSDLYKEREVWAFKLVEKATKEEDA